MSDSGKKFSTTAPLRPDRPMALEALSRQTVPPDIRPRDETRRDETIASIAAEIRSQARPVSVRWYAAIGAIAVASALGLFGWSHLSASSTGDARNPGQHNSAQHQSSELVVTGGVVVVTRLGQPTAVSVGQSVPIDEGQQIRTASDGSATLKLPRGVRANFGNATNAWLDAAGQIDQRFRIDAGIVDVSVPKPGGPRTVAVVTPDAQVVVRGTEFTVAVEQGDPKPSTITRVTVRRGSVYVLHHGTEDVISAGSTWSSSAAQPSASAPAEGPTTAMPSTESAPSTTSTLSALPRPRPQSGALAEQNRLFQAAAKARKNGDDETALRYLDELLSRYPHSELAQEVRIARFRTLKRLGRDSDAAREAMKYLSTERDGPARDEAREIVLDSTAPSSKTRSSTSK